MDLDIKDGLRLLDHLNKCRCCFEKFDHIGNQVDITEIIEEQFLELTQIELKSSPRYSKSVCLKCTNELQSISSFRSDLITKQQRLYDFVTTSEYKIQDSVKFEPVNVKIETQSSDELVNIFKLETQYEEIENTEVPFISETTKTNLNSIQQLASHSHSLRHRKPKVLQVKKTGQKKKLNKVQKIKLTTTTCPECGKTMSDVRNLSVHIRRVHLKEKNFFCDLCDYGSFIKSNFVEHMLTHIPLELREKLHCSKCEFVTISPHVMRTHVVNYHSTKNKDIIVCHCGKRFIDRSVFNNHTKNVHEKPKPHICSICDRVFTYTFHLEKHMQTHNNNQVKKKQTAIKQICPHCGIMMASYNTLTRHIRRLHLKEKRFSCDLCDYRSFSKNALVLHIPTHLSLEFREKLHCSKCDYVTISYQVMKSHIRSNCIEKEKVESVCYCGKVCSSKLGLNNHIIYTHQKKKNHFCTICDKAFIKPSELRIHMANHTGIRNVACEVCGKTFVDEAQLRTHSVYHKDPTFVCSFEGCTKKFYTLTNLNVHKKTHIDQRDFACNLCDKKYFVFNHLHRHILHFHKQLKVSCELPGCSSKFARKETYRNHVLSHHKDLSKVKTELLLKKIREMKQE